MSTTNTEQAAVARKVLTLVAVLLAPVLVTLVLAVWTGTAANHPTVAYGVIALAVAAALAVAQVIRGQLAQTVELLQATTEGLQGQMLAQETEMLAQMEEAHRMRGGVEAVSTNVMIADTNNDIIYMNETAKALFADLEHDLRKEMPHFNARELIGKNIDIFHKNPSHQQRLLKDLRGKYNAQFVVGGRTVQFTRTSSVS